jgi:hypothetical protein
MIFLSSWSAAMIVWLGMYIRKYSSLRRK